MSGKRIASYVILSYLIIFIVCIALFFLASFASWVHDIFGIPSEFTFGFVAVVSIALTVGIPIALAVYNRRQKEQALIIKAEWEKRYREEQERKYRGLQIANIDLMTGIEFEQYLQKILASQDYSVSVTRASGDLGVDLIALKDDDKIAIQAKRYNTKVSRRAISDAVAGMYHYGCNKAMVITNNYFSPGAVALAQSTGCILIDRSTLADWVNEFRNTNSESLSERV